MGGAVGGRDSVTARVPLEPFANSNQRRNQEGSAPTTAQYTATPPRTTAPDPPRPSPFNTPFAPRTTSATPIAPAAKRTNGWPSQVRVSISVCDWPIAGVGCENELKHPDVGEIVSHRVASETGRSETKNASAWSDFRRQRNRSEQLDRRVIELCSHVFALRDLRDVPSDDLHAARHRLEVNRWRYFERPEAR